MGSPSDRSPRYWSLDILRGICALTVFLNHWVLWSNFAPGVGVETHVHGWLHQAYELFVFFAWPTGGLHPALICFFVLSGFCVHGPFERRLVQGVTPGTWADYFVRRFRRIAPVYWFAALLGLLVVAAESWRPTQNPLLMLHAAATPGGIAARLGCYTGLWPNEVWAGNYILGTVSVEVLIYLAYPLFFRAAASGHWGLLAAGAVAMQLGALFLLPYFDPFVLFTSGLMMGLFWYLGALAAHWRQTRNWTVRGWWLGLAWVVFLTLKVIPSFRGVNMLKQTVVGILSMLIIVWLLDWEKRRDPWRTLLWVRLGRWFGAISYPLYAVHTPVMLLVNWTMLTTLAQPDYGWELVINLLLSLSISVAVHYGVENRFYRTQVQPGTIQ